LMCPSLSMCPNLEQVVREWSGSGKKDGVSSVWIARVCPYNEPSAAVLF
jgi:hypothetical protein